MERTLPHSNINKQGMTYANLLKTHRHLPSNA